MMFFEVILEEISIMLEGPNGDETILIFLFLQAFIHQIIHHCVSFRGLIFKVRDVKLALRSKFTAMRAISPTNLLLHDARAGPNVQH